MATYQQLLLFPVLLFCILFVIPAVKCDSEEDDLLQGINSYRTNLSLTPLTKNKNAECFADELAKQFETVPCTNTTGTSTISGTEIQSSNYTNLLAKCHLILSNTGNGSIMPVCVPDLDPDLVLSNYTQSAQFSGRLKESKYTGIGIGSDNDWTVVILTTSTPEGSYSPASPLPSPSPANAAGLSSSKPFMFHLFFLLVGSLSLL